MIPILVADSYRGFSARLDSSASGAQPIFIGRVLWPGSVAPEDAVIKMYANNTCGTANEAIGYAANAVRGINQPKKGAILLLSQRELPKLGFAVEEFVDRTTGLVACWATSLEQNISPFRFVRRLSSFSEKQVATFYKSKFCRLLAAVDHVTGNNDRHEGNFLYVDDLNYLAIDQGCIGGGLQWHTTWPDTNARNEILHLALHTLGASGISIWKADAIMEHERSQPLWAGICEQLRLALVGILENDAIEMIIEYMENRAGGPKFAISCGKLI